MGVDNEASVVDVRKCISRVTQSRDFLVLVILG